MPWNLSTFLFPYQAHPLWGVKQSWFLSTPRWNAKGTICYVGMPLKRHHHHQKKVDCKAPSNTRKSMYFENLKNSNFRKNTSQRFPRKEFMAASHPVCLPSCKVFSKGFGINVARMAKKPPSKLVMLMMVVLWSPQPTSRFGLSQKKTEKNLHQNGTSKLKNRIMFDACHAYCSGNKLRKKTEFSISRKQEPEKSFF